ncbi:hypothetical protein [Halorussus lipolyticus]|uniref:hypothetical protein n=1 Tax=Halorussus lipolyticus TaxID=3034024 RepID=UPI0023E781B4|nr:hypothetical protein [Halorussus sp. DT80]
MSVRSGDLTEKWYEYVYRNRAESVRRFAEEYPENRSLSVSCERFGHDYRFVRPLLADPDDALRAGKAALKRFLADEDREMQDIYLRVTDLPDESRVALADLRAEHLNRLHTTRGVVAEAGECRPKVVRAGFRCAKCEDVTRHVAQPGREFRSHAKCPRCNSVGYLSFAPGASEYVDAQEIRLRDPTGADAVPVLLEHDLAGSVSDGDELRLVGIPRASRTDDSTVADLWVESVSMECLTDSNR